MDRTDMEKKRYVATIGMFDGVHRGHQFVLRQVVEKARERGLQPMAITFDHSLHRDQVLTPLNEKQRLIHALGIDRIEVLSFTDQLRQMTAYEFMRQVLSEQLDVKVLLTGYDNRFGRNREKGFDDYVAYGQELGIEVLQLPAEGNVSSSLVRQLLADGRVAEATDALGHPYQMTGCVVHGEHIGTRLGYPTANLMPVEPYQLVPAPGVYAVRVELGDSVYGGMMNIGHRPTFDGNQTTLEVHILHWSDDLYGRNVTIHFVKRLRSEQRFGSEDDLKHQLMLDAAQAEEILNH